MASVADEQVPCTGDMSCRCPVCLQWLADQENAKTDNKRKNKASAVPCTGDMSCRCPVCLQWLADQEKGKTDNKKKEQSQRCSLHW